MYGCGVSGCLSCSIPLISALHKKSGMGQYLARQFAANEENRMSRNSPPLPRRGVFASYRFVLNSSTSGALKFLALIWYNTCLNAYDVPSLPSKKAGLHVSRGLVADSFALQPGDQGHHERLFPAAGGSAITVRFRARPARNPDERRHFQE